MPGICGSPGTCGPLSICRLPDTCGPLGICGLPGICGLWDICGWPESSMPDPDDCILSGVSSTSKSVSGVSERGGWYADG